jgi:hypothetical protein
MATKAELEQEMEEAIIEGRRKKRVERRVHEIFVENDRRRLDRRAVDRRGIDRRIAGRRDTDPNVDEMVAKLQAQQHKKKEGKDHFHHIQLLMAFLSGIIVSQIVNFYMEENILTLLLTFFSGLL